MRAGELRHFVVIDLKTTGIQDTYGTPSNTWTSNIGTWASIVPFGGREYFNARQAQASETHRITIRHQTLAASTIIGPGYCRLRFESRTFEISSVRNIEERDATIEMLCVEKT